MKLPFMKWYCGDWKKDPRVSMCDPRTRGIWFDLLNDMHELDQQGFLSGTADELARSGRCSVAQLKAAVQELKRHGVADVTERNDRITIANRRMTRESNARQLNQKRQLRFRQRHGDAENNGDNNGKVTLDMLDIRSQISEDRDMSGLPDSNQSLVDRTQEVFDYWREVTGHHEAILGAKRERAIAGRLKQGYTVERLKAAIDGNHRSEYHQGDNDKHLVYDDLELICRDEKHVDQFIAIGKAKNGSNEKSIPFRKAPAGWE